MMDFEDHESMETKKIHLRTHHGMDFEVNLYNSESVTHFGCPNWEALCKMYDFHEGVLVTMDLGDPSSSTCFVASSRDVMVRFFTITTSVHLLHKFF